MKSLQSALCAFVALSLTGSKLRSQLRSEAPFRIALVYPSPYRTAMS